VFMILWSAGKGRRDPRGSEIVGSQKPGVTIKEQALVTLLSHCSSNGASRVGVDSLNAGSFCCPIIEIVLIYASRGASEKCI
jgi:hypothetical protein